MHVTHRTVHRRQRHIQDSDSVGHHNASFGPRQDLPVASAIDERRQPADFQLKPPLEQDIRFIQGGDVAWPGIDEVRVFGPPREARDLYLVAANLFSDGTEIGESRNHVELCLGRRRGKKHAKSRDEEAPQRRKPRNRP